MRFVSAVALALVMLWVPVDGVAQCPEGTWPRNLSTGMGGGMSTGMGSYCSNIPPWPVFVEYLEDNGYLAEAKLIRDAFARALRNPSQRTPVALPEDRPPVTASAGAANDGFDQLMSIMRALTNTT
jgi:hypothetical protein